MSVIAMRRVFLTIVLIMFVITLVWIVQISSKLDAQMDEMFSICDSAESRLSDKDTMCEYLGTCNTGTSNSQLPFINSTIKLPTVCSNEACRSAYVRHFQQEDTYPIPKIRHILWKNGSVSEYFAEQLRSWQIIHPDWTFVLWRDADLEPLVATHFPGLLAKFKSLPHHIMRIDMIRFMLLYKYGGTYADLDYRLVRNLDTYRRFHAVVTREPDAHSLQLLGMSWPVNPLVNPAFMMSAPGHIFNRYVMQQLASKVTPHVLEFAGPHGLSNILETYQSQFPIANNAMETVYIPPSNSFYPYRKNRLNTGKNFNHGHRAIALRGSCKSLWQSNEPAKQRLKCSPNLRQFCTDLNNMDPITDKSQPVFAIHDTQKSGNIWDGLPAGVKFFTHNLTDARLVIKNLKFGSDFLNVSS